MLAWLNTHKTVSLLLTVVILAVVLIALWIYIGYAIPKTIGIGASDISQCETIPVGHKACGGPDGYIIYSTKTTNVRLLLSLVDIRDNFSAIILSLTGSTSDCAVEMPPELGLVDGKCVAASRFPDSTLNGITYPTIKPDRLPI